MTAPSHITVSYLLAVHEADAERIAREIALEQTVEVPESLVVGAGCEELVGTVESVEEIEPGRSLARISYRSDLAGGHLQQLVNLIYGNISIKSGIRLVSLDLPHDFVARFAGPRYGIAGVRARLGVYGRPLVSTALKPKGSSTDQLAALASEFALAGGDIVKDDHNLTDADYDAFATRVRTIQAAVDAANRLTGLGTLYVPNVSVPVDQLDAAMVAAQDAGAAGIMLAPALIGLDSARLIAERYGLIVIAHPTFYGAFFHDPTHGVEPSVLLGTLERLAGVDISVFPNAGGRFSFSSDQCNALADALRNPLGDLRPAWPAPAGGMNLAKVAGMSEQYGEDAIFLLGAALRMDGSSLRESTTQLLALLKDRYRERREKPQERSAVLSHSAHTGASHRTPVPAQPFNDNAEGYEVRAEVLKCSQDFEWPGRERIPYKGQKRLPFEGISRVELFGKHGELGDFELRYFEIKPGGFSSREKHLHSHCVIAARGVGIVTLDGERRSLKPNDFVHIPPMVVHQFLNEGKTPFGFYCVVNRRRDRPMDPGS